MAQELEQEVASIVKFILDRAGGPAPYYWNVPSNFVIPAVYFPPPEIETGGETFLTYNMDYVWYVKLFDKTKQDAYAMGLNVLAAIKAERNLVPMISEDGSTIPQSWVRINDPTLKVLDDGAAQLTVRWRSRRPYSDSLADPAKAQTVSVDIIGKPAGRTIEDVYAEALEQYAVPTGSQPE